MLVGEVRSRVEAIFEEKPCKDLDLARNLGAPDEGGSGICVRLSHECVVCLLGREVMPLE